MLWHAQKTLKLRVVYIRTFQRIGGYRLVHDASLAVTVAVRLGVHLVRDGSRGLVVTGGAAAAETSGAAGRRGVLVGGRGAAHGTTDGTWLAGEAVVALLATSENTALLLEVAHGNGRQSGCGVVLGSVVVNLVDGDSGVNDGRLNGF